MRRLSLLTALLVFGTLPALAQAPKVAPATKQGGEEEEVERKIVGGGRIPTGWVAKTDRNAPIAKVKFEQTAGGLPRP